MSIWEKPKHLIAIGKAFRFLSKQASIQRNFTAPFLQAILQEDLAQNDGSLQPRHWRRMYDYPLQFVVFFGDIICLLHQKKLTEIERKKLTLYAAAGCLIDDFFDEKDLTNEEIWQLYQSPHTFPAQNTKEQVCKRLLSHLFDAFPKNEDFENVCHQFYKAQIDSLRQTQKEILEFPELQDISDKKGGLALMISRYLFLPNASEEEQAMVYILGAWYQLLDDILDIGKDVQKGNQTLLTNTQDINEIETVLNQKTKHLFDMIRALHFPPKLKEQSIDCFWVIGTSGWVHLHHLKKLQRKSQNSFHSVDYTLEELTWKQDKISHFWIAFQIWLSKKY